MGLVAARDASHDEIFVESRTMTSSIQGLLLGAIWIVVVLIYGDTYGDTRSCSHLP